jgi:hypothetical protein
MADSYKLGKLPAAHDPVTPRMADFVDFSIALPAARATHHTNVVHTYPMFGNDKYGDCVEACIAHQIELNCTLNKRPTPGIEADSVLGLYSDLTGFKPDDPSSDKGTVLLTAWQHWRDVGCFGDKLAGFMQIDPTDWLELMIATQLFESVGIGIQMPKTALEQTEAGKEWAVTGPLTGDAAVGSWGGHCVPCISIDDGTMVVASWEKKIKVSKEFITAYADEAYVALSDSVMKGSLSASGFDEQKLQAYLADL